MVKTKVMAAPISDLRGPSYLWSDASLTLL